jgi:uncharacterized membrane protein (UPF0127 family)
MHKSFRSTGLFSPVFFLAYLLAMAVILPLGATAQSMLLPTAQLTIGAHKIQAEVAATDASRSNGLMNRTSLPDNHGMLFVFDGPTTTCFWMKNTPLPLSIAFIDSKGKIVNIADMQPHSLDSHCPLAPVTHALEMQQGWFRQHSVTAGAVVNNLPQP